MNNATLLGPWIRRFLLEHLVSERNLSRNTQHSYRDTIALLMPFVAGRLHKFVDRLLIIDLSAELVRSFLTDIEQSRGCAISTRNQRLAAVHALARFIGLNSPEHIAWSGELRAVPFQEGEQVCGYLSGTVRDGFDVGGRESRHRPRKERSCTPAVPLQLRGSCRRSGTIADR